MKRKIAYWVALGLFATAMTGAAIGYLAGSQQMAAGFQHLGYPSYFRLLLGVAKLVGVVFLLAPKLPLVLREWAFAGFGITLVSAAISHGACGDPAGEIAAPLIMFGVLILARCLRWPRLRSID
jgi:hypothetical protein